MIIPLHYFGLIVGEENIQVEELIKHIDADSNKIGDLLIRYEKSLRYFEENYEKVNVDGLFGVQISGGNLEKNKLYLLTIIQMD